MPLVSKIYSFVSSFISSMILPTTEKGVFGYFFGLWGQKAWNGFMRVLYNIGKWFLAFMDFLQYFIQKLIGLDYWLDSSIKGRRTLAEATTEDTIFKFLYADSVQKVFRALIVVFIILLIVFTIFQIIKSEWDFMTGDGKNGNSKNAIFRSSFKAILMVIIFPIMLIMGIVSSNAILASIIKAVSVDMAETFGGKIFSIAAQSANKYRAYVNADTYIPTTDQVAFYLNDKHEMITFGTGNQQYRSYHSNYQEYLLEIKTNEERKYTIDSIFDPLVPKNQTNFSGFCFKITDEEENYKYYFVSVGTDKKEAMFYYLTRCLGAKVLGFSEDAEFSDEIGVALSDELKLSESTTEGNVSGYISGFDMSVASETLRDVCRNSWKYSLIYIAPGKKLSQTLTSQGGQELWKYGLASPFDDATSGDLLDDSKYDDGEKSRVGAILYNSSHIDPYFDGGQFGVVQSKAEYSVMADVVDFMCENTLTFYIMNATSALIDWNYHFDKDGDGNIETSENYVVGNKWISQNVTKKIAERTGVNGDAPYYLKKSENAIKILDIGADPNDVSKDVEVLTFLTKYSNNNSLPAESDQDVIYTASFDAKSELEGARYIICMRGENGFYPLVNGEEFVIDGKEYTFSSPQYDKEYRGVVWAKGTFDDSTVDAYVGNPTYLQDSSNVENKNGFGFVDKKQTADPNAEYYYRVFVKDEDNTNANGADKFTIKYYNYYTNFIDPDSDPATDIIGYTYNKGSLYKAGAVTPESVNLTTKEMVVKIPDEYDCKYSLRETGNKLKDTSGNKYVEYATEDSGICYVIYVSETNNTQWIYDYSSNALTPLSNNLTPCFLSKTGARDASDLAIRTESFTMPSASGFGGQDFVDINEALGADAKNTLKSSFSIYNGDEEYFGTFTKTSLTPVTFGEIATKTKSFKPSSGGEYFNINVYGVVKDELGDTTSSLFGSVNTALCVYSTNLKLKALLEKFDYTYNSDSVTCFRSEIANLDNGSIGPVLIEINIKLFQKIFDIKVGCVQQVTGPRASHTFYHAGANSGITFDYFFDQNVRLTTFYAAAKINLPLLFISSILIIKVLFTALWGVIKRFYMITLYYLAMPVAASTMPMDGGTKFTNVRTGITKEVLSTYGVLIGLNLFFVILSPIKDIAYSIFTEEMIANSGSYFLIKLSKIFNAKALNHLVYILFLLVAFTMIEELPKFVSNLVGAGDVVSSGEGVKKGAVKAVGTMKEFTSGAMLKTAVNSAKALPFVEGTAKFAQKTVGFVKDKVTGPFSKGHKEGLGDGEDGKGEGKSNSRQAGDSEHDGGTSNSRSGYSGKRYDKDGNETPDGEYDENGDLIKEETFENSRQVDDKGNPLGADVDSAEQEAEWKQKVETEEGLSDEEFDALSEDEKEEFKQARKEYLLSGKVNKDKFMDEVEKLESRGVELSGSEKNRYARNRAREERYAKSRAKFLGYTYDQETGTYTAKNDKAVKAEERIEDIDKELGQLELAMLQGGDDVDKEKIAERIDQLQQEKQDKEQIVAENTSQKTDEEINQELKEMGVEQQKKGLGMTFTQHGEKISKVRLLKGGEGKAKAEKRNKISEAKAKFAGLEYNAENGTYTNGETGEEIKEENVNEYLNSYGVKVGKFSGKVRAKAFHFTAATRLKNGGIDEVKSKKDKNRKISFNMQTGEFENDRGESLGNSLVSAHFKNGGKRFARGAGHLAREAGKFVAANGTKLAKWIGDQEIGGMSISNRVLLAKTSATTAYNTAKYFANKTHETHLSKRKAKFFGYKYDAKTGQYTNKDGKIISEEKLNKELNDMGVSQNKLGLFNQHGKHVRAGKVLGFIGRRGSDRAERRNELDKKKAEFFGYEYDKEKGTYKKFDKDGNVLEEKQQTEINKMMNDAGIRQRKVFKRGNMSGVGIGFHKNFTNMKEVKRFQMDAKMRAARSLFGVAGLTFDTTSGLVMTRKMADRRAERSARAVLEKNPELQNLSTGVVDDEVRKEYRAKKKAYKQAQKQTFKAEDVIRTKESAQKEAQRSINKNDKEIKEIDTQLEKVESEFAINPNTQNHTRINELRARRGALVAQNKTHQQTIADNQVTNEDRQTLRDAIKNEKLVKQEKDGATHKMKESIVSNLGFVDKDVREEYRAKRTAYRQAREKTIQAEDVVRTKESAQKEAQRKIKKNNKELEEIENQINRDDQYENESKNEYGERRSRNARLEERRRELLAENEKHEQTIADNQVTNEERQTLRDAVRNEKHAKQEKDIATHKMRESRASNLGITDTVNDIRHDLTPNQATLAKASKVLKTTALVAGAVALSTVPPIGVVGTGLIYGAGFLGKKAGELTYKFVSADKEQRIKYAKKWGGNALKVATVAGAGLLGGLPFASVAASSFIVAESNRVVRARNNAYAAQNAGFASGGRPLAQTSGSSQSQQYYSVANPQNIEQTMASFVYDESRIAEIVRKILRGEGIFAGDSERTDATAHIVNYGAINDETFIENKTVAYRNAVVNSIGAGTSNTYVASKIVGDVINNYASDAGISVNQMLFSKTDGLISADTKIAMFETMMNSEQRGNIDDRRSKGQSAEEILEFIESDYNHGGLGLSLNANYVAGKGVQFEYTNQAGQTSIVGNKVVVDNALREVMASEKISEESVVESIERTGNSAIVEKAISENYALTIDYSKEQLNNVSGSAYHQAVFERALNNEEINAEAIYAYLAKQGRLEEFKSEFHITGSEKENPEVMDLILGSIKASVKNKSSAVLGDLKPEAYASELSEVISRKVATKEFKVESFELLPTETQNELVDHVSANIEAASTGSDYAYTANERETKVNLAKGVVGNAELINTFLSLEIDQKDEIIDKMVMNQLGLGEDPSDIRTQAGQEILDKIGAEKLKELKESDSTLTDSAIILAYAKAKVVGRESNFSEFLTRNKANDRSVVEALMRGEEGKSTTEISQQELDELSRYQKASDELFAVQKRLNESVFRLESAKAQGKSKLELQHLTEAKEQIEAEKTALETQIGETFGATIGSNSAYISRQRELLGEFRAKVLANPENSEEELNKFMQKGTEFERFATEMFVGAKMNISERSKVDSGEMVKNLLSSTESYSKKLDDATGGRTIVSSSSISNSEFIDRVADISGNKTEMVNRLVLDSLGIQNKAGMIDVTSESYMKLLEEMRANEHWSKAIAKVGDMGSSEAQDLVLGYAKAKVLGEEGSKKTEEFVGENSAEKNDAILGKIVSVSTKDPSDTTIDGSVTVAGARVAIDKLKFEYLSEEGKASAINEKLQGYYRASSLISFLREKTGVNIEELRKHGAENGFYTMSIAEQNAKLVEMAKNDEGARIIFKNNGVNAESAMEVSNFLNSQNGEALRERLISKISQEMTALDVFAEKLGVSSAGVYGLVYKQNKVTEDVERYVKEQGENISLEQVKSYAVSEGEKSESTSQIRENVVSRFNVLTQEEENRARIQAVYSALLEAKNNGNKWASEALKKAEQDVKYGGGSTVRNKINEAIYNLVKEENFEAVRKIERTLETAKGSTFREKSKEAQIIEVLAKLRLKGLITEEHEKAGEIVGEYARQSAIVEKINHKKENRVNMMAFNLAGIQAVSELNEKAIAGNGLQRQNAIVSALWSNTEFRKSAESLFRSDKEYSAIGELDKVDEITRNSFLMKKMSEIINNSGISASANRATLESILNANKLNIASGAPTNSDVISRLNVEQFEAVVKGMKEDGAKAVSEIRGKIVRSQMEGLTEIPNTANMSASEIKEFNATKSALEQRYRKDNNDEVFTNLFRNVTLANENATLNQILTANGGDAEKAKLEALRNNSEYMGKVAESILTKEFGGSLETIKNHLKLEGINYDALSYSEKNEYIKALLSSESFLSKHKDIDKKKIEEAIESEFLRRSSTATNFDIKQGLSSEDISKFLKMNEFVREQLMRIGAHRPHHMFPRYHYHYARHHYYLNNHLMRERLMRAILTRLYREPELRKMIEAELLSQRPELRKESTQYINNYINNNTSLRNELMRKVGEDKLLKKDKDGKFAFDPLAIDSSMVNRTIDDLEYRNPQMARSFGGALAQVVGSMLGTSSTRKKIDKSELEKILKDSLYKDPTHKEFVKEIANKTIQEQFKSFLDGEMDSIIIQTKASIRTDSPLAIDIYNNANANKQSLAKRIRTEIARKQRSLK